MILYSACLRIMKTCKRFFFIFCLMIYITVPHCKLISRPLDSISQSCDQVSFEMQRVDVFEGDSVDLVCGCRHSETRGHNKKKLEISNGIVTDKSNYLDITTWSFSRQLSPFKESYFALHKNKEWAELMTKDEDAITTYSGNAETRDCVFPFHYFDHHHREVAALSCSSSGREDHTCWCSVTSNYTADKLWGFCPCASPRRGFRIMAELGTDPGRYCHFPFRYSGSEYRECIYEGRERCWCGTTYNVNHDNLWGYCPCASSSIKGSWGGWSEWEPCKCGDMTFRSRPCLTKKFKNLPTGRSVVCDGGFAVDSALCSCFMEYSDLKKQMSDFKERTAVFVPERHSVSPRIKIRNLTRSDSGWYYCWKGDVFKKLGVIQQRLKRVVAYELNVIEFDAIHLVRLDDGEKIPHKAGTYHSDVVKWEWTPWQLCDRCGVFTGEKRKFGFCMTEEPANSLVLDRTAPCSSPMMGESKMGRMKGFSNYMVVETCKTKCHRNRAKYKLIKMGKVEGLPTQRPPALRAIYHATVGQTMRLKCPGSDPLLPAMWQFEEKTMHASLEPLLRHKQNSYLTRHNGRIEMNDDLVLRKIALFSAGYFSCFVNRTLAATYYIKVEEDFLQKLQNILDFSIYVIIFLVGFVFLSVVYSVIKVERKAIAAY